MSELEITAENIEPRQVKLTVVVPGDRLERATQEAAQAFARQLRIGGYRPGHVPTRLVAAQVGDEALREQALERLTRQVGAEALRQQNLVPSAPVTVDKFNDEPLTFEIVVPLSPTVDLGDYAALRIDAADSVPVPEEAVDEILDAWRRDTATVAPVERPAEKGDIVALSLVVSLDGAIVFDDDSLALTLTSEGATEARLPAAIVEPLVGIQAGEERAFDLVYPEFWPQSELQGKLASVTAVASGVSAVIVPEADDAFAKEVSDSASIGELRARVRQGLEARQEIDRRSQHLEAVLDALVSRAKVDYAPATLQAEVAEIVADLQSRVERQGLKWERWLELQKKDQEALWDEIEPQARQRLERGLVLSEFVRAEGIDVAPEQVEAELKRIAARSDDKKSGRTRADDDLRRGTTSRLLTNKAFDRLLAIAAGQAAATALGTDEGASGGAPAEAGEESGAGSGSGADAPASTLGDTGRPARGR